MIKYLNLLNIKFDIIRGDFTLKDELEIACSIKPRQIMPTDVTSNVIEHENLYFLRKLNSN